MSGGILNLQLSPLFMKTVLLVVFSLIVVLFTIKMIAWIGEHFSDKQQSILFFAWIIVIIFANYWIFQSLLELNYVRWYIKNGTMISLGFSIVSFASGDINNFKDLISSNHRQYLSDSFRLVSLPLVAFGTIIENSKTQDGSSFFPINIIEFLSSLAFGLFLVLAASAWLIFVVPLQYFVYIIAGAPSREMLLSTKKMLYWKSPFEIKAVPKDQKIPDGAVEVAWFSKPVTLASTIAALILWVLSQMIP